ncbi:phospholipase A2 inhibitor and Ly6/PLAUR domain-containing protein-like [Budorcas taxicolor]|uniref:phospholipase A2 inhibitor and Ly6/PLAUR domain-containing protein-like n=1 Tax=Budorcas taxicolor TaxID=37181 RepID=UPI002284499B|nr:phospholipase A2 inhibitor and Ly6/PLAUR domain-containing protein-like [Budorcas taxicolor]
MKPSMKPETFLLATTLLCTLLGLGYPLSCEVCVGDGPSCTGKLQPCAPDEDSCVVVVTATNRKASLAATSYKGCAKSSECDSGFFGITVNPENYMGSRRRCCQQDGCNQDPLPAFVRNHTENGLRCPSCIAAFTETCTASEEALCVGEETHCVAVSGLVQPAGVKFAVQGCGMETACHTKPGTLVPSGARLFTIKKTSCL